MVNVSEDMELYASVRRRCRRCGEAFRIAQHFDVAVLPENGRRSHAENRRTCKNRKIIKVIKVSKIRQDCAWRPLGEETVFGEETPSWNRQAQESLYGTKRIMLPTPQCVVFYNGEKEIPEEEILRLSDSFEGRKEGAGADIELTVRMFNINHGHNQELMGKCQVLREYAAFAELSRRYLSGGMEPKKALEAAITDCIEQDILAGFLRKYRAEVLGMLLEEFDVKKYERSLREEGWEEGREEESARYSKLICVLFEQHREQDVKRAAEDPEYRKRLYEKFDIS